jgi:alpha-L-arabinofuranosidase
MNNADCVKVACLAQLVNVIGAIMTETGGPAWRQTNFHPFSQAARYGHGNVLRTHTHTHTDSYATAGYPKLDYLLASVLHDEHSGRCTVFALNRSATDAMQLSVELTGLGHRRLVSASELHHAELKAENTRSSPEAVKPSEHAEVSVKGTHLQAKLRPLSWNVFVTQPV